MVLTDFHVFLLLIWLVAGENEEETVEHVWEFKNIKRENHPSRCTCGPLIVPAKPYPWTVYVHSKAQSCPGTVVNSNLVVTSHACLLVDPDGTRMRIADLFQFRYGPKSTHRKEEIRVTSTQNETASGAQTFRVVNVQFNPRFARSSELKMFPEHDMVIIQVKEDLLSVGFRPVCVPSYDESMKNSFQLSGKFRGYFRRNGSIEDSIIGTIHKKDKCTEDSKSKSNVAVCIKYTGGGDSLPGEPLIVESAKRSFLAGIAISPIYAEVDTSGKDASLGIQHAYFSFINTLIKYIEYYSGKARSKWCVTPKFTWKSVQNPTSWSNSTQMDSIVERLRRTGSTLKAWEDNTTYMDRLQILDCICGENYHQIFRVVGGVTTKQREFGWMASLSLYRNGDREAGGSVCGGSIINDRIILTAAHCVVDELWVTSGQEKVSYSPADIDVVLNAHKRQGDEESFKIEIVSVLFHPDYPVGLASSRKYIDNDIALLVLKAPLEFEPGRQQGLRPVCLPKRGKYLPVVGRQATVVGWGLTNPDKMDTVSETLQKLSVPIQELTVCKSIIPRTKVSDKFLCAGTLDKYHDAALGDSGGPLQIQDPKTRRWTQVGAVSFGQNAARGGKTAALYTDLQKFVDFIDYHSHRVHARWCQSPGPFDNEQ